MPEKLEEILTAHFGRDTAPQIWRQANSIHQKLCVHAVGQSKGRQKNLIHSVYPFVAIYSALINSGMPKATALDHMFAIMEVYTTQGNRKMYQALGRLPFFFSLFRKMFRTGLKGDSWAVEWVADSKQEFSYNIKACLWHEACTELGCPELCRIFCRNDEINFINVSKHLYFERSTTLGEGGDCCDFHFYPRPKNKN